MNASPFFIPFFLGEVTSFKYSIDTIVMPICQSKQRSQLVNQFSINVTFIRMSALKTKLKTTPFHQEHSINVPKGLKTLLAKLNAYALQYFNS